MKPKRLAVLSVVPSVLLTLYAATGFLSEQVELPVSEIDLQINAVKGLETAWLESDAEDLLDIERTISTKTYQQIKSASGNLTGIDQSAKLYAENLNSLEDTFKVFDDHWSTDIENSTVEEIKDLIERYKEVGLPSDASTISMIDDFKSRRVEELDEIRNEIVKKDEQKLRLRQATQNFQDGEYEQALKEFDLFDITVFDKQLPISEKELGEFKTACKFFVRLETQLRNLETIESSLSSLELVEFEAYFTSTKVFLSDYTPLPNKCDTGRERLQRVSQARDSLHIVYELVSEPFVKDLSQVSTWFASIKRKLSVTKLPKRTTSDLKRRLAKSLKDNMVPFFEHDLVLKPPMELGSLNQWKCIYDITRKRMVISKGWIKMEDTLDSTDPNTPPPSGLYSNAGILLKPPRFIKLGDIVNRVNLPIDSRRVVDRFIAEPLGSELPLIGIYDKANEIRLKIWRDDEPDFDRLNEVRDETKTLLTSIADYKEYLQGGVPNDLVTWLERAGRFSEILLENQKDIEEFLELLD